MEFSEYYVAYFDVLGYKDAFEKLDDVSAKLVKSIEELINLMKQILSIVNAQFGETFDEKTEIEYKIFSDNVLICYKKTKNHLSELHLISFLRLIATIQRVFCEGHQLIVRGGITKGPLYLTKDFVGGKALIDVVELENNAVYPRIVVDGCVLSEVSSIVQNDVFKSIVDTSCLDLLVKHIDDKTFLNYIMVYNAWIPFPKEGSQSESIESFEELEKLNREGRLPIPKYNPECLQEISVILRKHKEFVEEMVNEFSQSLNDEKEETKRLKVLKKYLWLVSFHNKICGEIYKMPELKINLNSAFNEQTLAFDVSAG